MQKNKLELIQNILHEAEAQNLAFVEDDWIISDDGDEVYNPEVDNVNSLMWLKEKLEELARM